MMEVTTTARMRTTTTMLTMFGDEHEHHGDVECYPTCDKANGSHLSEGRYVLPVHSARPTGGMLELASFVWH